MPNSWRPKWPLTRGQAITTTTPAVNYTASIGTHSPEIDNQIGIHHLFIDQMMYSGKIVRPAEVEHLFQRKCSQLMSKDLLSDVRNDMWGCVRATRADLCQSADGSRILIIKICLTKIIRPPGCRELRQNWASQLMSPRS